MMAESHQQALNLLVGSIGLIILIIVGTLVFSQLKKKPSDKVKTEGEPGLETGASSVPVPRELETPPQTANLQKALSKTEAQIFGRISKLFASEIAPKDVLENIEEVLYTSDLGPKTVRHLMEALEEDLSRSERKNIELVRTSLKNSMTKILQGSEMSGVSISLAPNELTVLMIVGVNGAGKTTSIGKLAAQFASQNKKVLVAAGDTFRAAAASQLKTWTERAQVEIFSPAGVTDPGAVAFDAVSKAKANGFDIVIIDTAGRLHTQSNLMEELKKVDRVIKKVIPAAPHETLIVLDANMGQNALVQAKEFHQAVKLTGAILTKMDGTAKGGVAIGLVNDLQIPVRYIGVGEQIGDLRVFDKLEFVESIFAESQS